MIQFGFYSKTSLRNLLKHETFWNILRFSSSSSSSGSDDSLRNPKTTGKNNAKKIPVAGPNLKFHTVLNYLERSIPLFIGDNNEDEWQEFHSVMAQLKSDLEATDFAQKIDKLTLVHKFDYQKFLRERHLQSRSSLLSDGSLSGLLYPDMNLWNKTLPQQFLLDFMVANILGVMDFLNKNNDTFEDGFNYSRVPSLGHDFIARNNLPVSTNSNENKNNHLAISYDNNFYLIDMDLYDNHYWTLWQIMKYILGPTVSKSPFPIGIISTLPRNDCMYGYKFLNEADLSKIRKSKLLVVLEKIDPNKHGQNDGKSSDRDQLLASMARQVLISDKENIGDRWFDKSLQLIFVLGNKVDQLCGHGICFEQSHTKIDSILKLMDHSIQFLTKFKPNETAQQKDIQFKRLHLFDPKSKRLAEILNQATNQFAMEKYCSICERYNLAMFQFKDYGFDLIENHIQAQPEHWIQMAVNLAMFKLTKQSRPCYQRCVHPEQDNEETWLQCYNQEVSDYVSDPHDRKKLLIALESLRFHQNLLVQSSKPGFNVEANFLVYQNLLKSGGELSKNHPNESEHLESLFRLKSFKRLRRSTIQLTTLKPKDYYDWHLVSHGHPFYDHRINITTHLAKTCIHFSISMLRANDQLFRFTIDQMKYELDQCLKQLKNVFQS